MCAPSGTVLGGGAGPVAELRRRLRARRDGADAGVLAVEELEPLRQRTLPERGRQLAARVPPASPPYCRSAELRPADHLAHRREEPRLERREREPATVGRRVDAVARETPGEETVARVAAEAMLDERVAPMRHRDARAARPSPGARRGARAPQGSPSPRRARLRRDRRSGVAARSACPRAAPAQPR